MPPTDHLSQLISAALTVISDDDQLNVLLLIIRTITKTGGKHQSCRYQNNCGFGIRWLVKHELSISYNPYLSTPTFSESHLHCTILIHKRQLP